MANLAVPKGLTLTPGVVIGAATKSTDHAEPSWPDDPEHLPLPTFDTAVLIHELALSNQLPVRLDMTDHDWDSLAVNPEAHLVRKAIANGPDVSEQGTYRDSALKLTKVYQMIEEAYKSFMDAANFEPSVPHYKTIEEKRLLYGFTDPATDNYPPHLNLGSNKKYAEGSEAQSINSNTPGSKQKILSQGDLFAKMRLAQLTALLPCLIPQNIVGKIEAGIGQGLATLTLGSMGRPDQGETIADVEEYNRTMRHRTGGLFDRNDIFNLPNIGDLDDWWSDRRFGQQFLTGPNPASLELATDVWVDRFIGNAGTSDSDQRMKKKIQELKSKDKDASLYMQDYSYFRNAAKLGKDDDMICDFPETYGTGLGKKTRTSHKYGVASVCLFHLQDDGMLQPLAIILDWRGSADKSVFVYNKELSLSEQKVDWPWRYAKTCVQCSDWTRHEVTVHLTNTHLIEEATIVGAQRSFTNDHPVFQLLFPHWQKTLSINASARQTLIPSVIIELIGMPAQQVKDFIMYEYSTFNFKESYVPTDLKNRGFDPARQNETKYLNYAYARCIYSMWNKIHSFVEEMLALSYDSDEAVAKDESIKYWYKSMQAPGGEGDKGGAGISTFPTIDTFEELVNAVTMCIHLASPQHTAVNYLQNYYQSFVVSKPPCFYTPPPRSRAVLDSYTEDDLVEALPMNHPREWLLASHIPYLLSAKPGDKESLIIYAASKYHIYKDKTDPKDVKIKEAAAKFYKALADTEKEFKSYGADVWDSDVILYDVLSPAWNAVSIVI